MSARQKDILKNIEYPESDGNPMAETDKHIQQMIDLRFALREFFRDQSAVYVGSNLLLYYVEGDFTKSVAPDVFVTRGVANHDRRTYLLWEERQAPQVVFEISSRATKNDDLQWKKQLYGWLGVQEYFIFDPEYKLKPPLRAFRWHNRELIEEVVSNHRVASVELGLELVNDGKSLRLFNPQTGEFLRTSAEETVARQKAENRADRLAAKLRELGIDPDHL